MAYDTFRFEIIGNIATIGTREYNEVTWNKEINLVSWNGRQPKIDIREWTSDHSKMGKGITLTDDEAEVVGVALVQYIRERSK